MATRSKRRFRAKTKTNTILALTAPTLAPCHPPLRCVFSPLSADPLFCLAAAQVKDKTADPAEQGIKNVIEGFKQNQKQSGTR
jgi:hypothetical protein